MRFLAPVLLALLTTPLAAQDYLVLAAFPDGDPFDAAASTLAEHHGAPIVRFDVGDLEPVRQKLIATTPRHVALVMRPEQIDFAFQRRFLQLATEIDDDPFVDFAFGYVTGRTAEDARALAIRSATREPSAERPTVATVGGGMESSMISPRPHALRNTTLEAVSLYCAGEDAFPEVGRDREFLTRELPRLTGRDAVTFVGHGWPREVAGGPTYEDLDGLDLEGVVALNVACYTGVTNTWFDEDYQNGVIHRREVPLDESFGLALLRTGVVGYTAYLCPRPAGPELDTDLAALLADGLSIGDARRRDYDKTVLGFLGFGEERMQLDGPTDGEKLARNRDAVRDMMLEGATGGVVFGDPACVPFRGLEGESPVAIDVKPVDGGLQLHARASLITLYLHCSDPTASFGDTMAMKVYARLPLGELLVQDVVVDELQVGREALPSRVLWAIEQDQGERFLQLKVNFPRRQWTRETLSMAARVITTDDPSLAAACGGEAQQPPAVTPDVYSREIRPALLERATAREVSREALRAALDASAYLLHDDSVEPGSMERLGAFESEGFRAVCAMLEFGHSHHRSWKLLEVTWQPGDERHLIALAAIDDLPNFASWQVLEGLGVADTPEVRAYLLERLASEEHAGLYMSCAEGLAHLGAHEASTMIGDRVLEFREGWFGVERQLVAALAELGDPVAIQKLEAIAVDPRSDAWPSALKALDRLDQEAAARVRAGRNDR